MSANGTATSVMPVVVAMSRGEAAAEVEVAPAGLVTSTNHGVAGADRVVVVAAAGVLGSDFNSPLPAQYLCTYSNI
jgi:hypothetical protein